MTLKMRAISSSLVSIISFIRDQDIFIDEFCCTNADLSAALVKKKTNSKLQNCTTCFIRSFCVNSNSYNTGLIFQFFKRKLF